MKRTLITVGLLLALAGCSKTVYVNDTTPPDTTEKKRTTTTDAPIATAPISTQAPSYWSVEDEFIIDIESSYGPIYMDESEVIATGYATCTLLRSGGTASDVYLAIASAGYNDFVIAVVASAVVNFCPDQQWKFN